MVTVPHMYVYTFVLFSHANDRHHWIGAVITKMKFNIVPIAWVTHSFSIPSGARYAIDHLKQWV